VTNKFIFNSSALLAIKGMQKQINFFGCQISKISEVMTCVILFLYLFIYFWQYCGLSSGLLFARQVFYHLSHALALFLV
jgi:hypothetical protein